MNFLFDVIGLICLYLIATLGDSTLPEPITKKILTIKDNLTIKSMCDESNRIRAEAGKHAHQLSEELCKAAQGHAEYMAEHGNMSHYINGSPSSRAKDAGWNGGFVTENIACGQRSVKSVFAVWRNSGGHYANMTGRYDRCGFGTAKRGNMIYWCAVYARSIPKIGKKNLNESR